MVLLNFPPRRPPENTTPPTTTWQARRREVAVTGSSAPRWGSGASSCGRPTSPRAGARTAPALAPFCPRERPRAQVPIGARRACESRSLPAARPEREPLHPSTSPHRARARPARQRAPVLEEVPPHHRSGGGVVGPRLSSLRGQPGIARLYVSDADAAVVAAVATAASPRASAPAVSTPTTWQAFGPTRPPRRSPNTTTIPPHSTLPSSAADPAPPSPPHPEHHPPALLRLPIPHQSTCRSIERPSLDSCGLGCPGRAPSPPALHRLPPPP